MTDPMPSTRRIHSWLPFVAAIAVPLIVLAVMGVSSFDQIRREAELRAQRTVQALSEHALRTFRAHDLIINAVDQYIAGWGWDRIDASLQLHEYFQALIRNAEDLNTIFVIGPTGTEGNGSLIFPLAPTDMTGRPFYEEPRREGGLHISAPDIGRVNRQPYFSVTRRRSSPGESFDGVISVSVNPGYFAKFYRTMVEGPADSVALVRADGLLLVRIPEFHSAGTPARTAAADGLLGAIRDHPVKGQFSQNGSVDGVRRIYTYHRVGDYPLYVAYGLGYDNVWAAWQRTMLTYTVVCAIAMGLLIAAAAMMRRHNRREAQVTARYAREAALRTAAEQASRAKDEFLAALSHELRNPLSSIAAGVEILRRANVVDTNGARALDIIARQTDHLRHLLNDLLDVARSTYGKMSLDPQAVSLLEMAWEVATTYPGAMRRQVTVTVGGVRAWVRADPTRLRQMIENIVDNAYKYGARTIAMQVAEAGDMATLDVVDDGDGIPAELLPRLFEPFVQGRQSLDRAAGGLGLGLALVQHLAVAHGGSLLARSDGPGKGSTFTIRLPKAAPPEYAPVAAPTPETPADGVRVLVVEDQEDARTSLRMLLESEHYVVETASSGGEGVAKFATFSPSVVLVDIGLPDMSGYHVAQAIRAHESGTHARLIALTGYGQPHDQRLAGAAGFDVHMTKPVAYDALKTQLSPTG